MFLVLCISILSISLLPGCSEEDKAGAKELWLGIPNKTPPKTPILEAEQSDSPEIVEYKRQAIAARNDIYSNMKSREPLLRFAEKADDIDLQNITSLLYSSPTPSQVDDHFERNLSLQLPPPQRRYTAMDFQQGANADMYRFGGALQDAGAQFGQIAAREREKEIISEARKALQTYALKMEKVKIKLLKEHDALAMRKK